MQEKLLAHLGLVLYEYLGEEYPEVLGSILGALKVSCYSLLVADVHEGNVILACLGMKVVFDHSTGFLPKMDLACCVHLP